MGGAVKMDRAILEEPEANMDQHGYGRARRTEQVLHHKKVKPTG